MKRSVIFRSFAALLVAATLLCSGAPVLAQQGQLQNLTFMQGHLQRDFLFYRPAAAGRTNGPRPLVLVIHGGAGTARGMVRLTKRRWNQLADQHGFYVVYPNGLDKIWDFGEGRVSSRLTQNVDDLDYFQSVIAATSSIVDVDGRRVFATGLSRGAQASFFLACNLTQQIRAIAPVATNLPEYMVNECQSGPPVGMALITGTADPQVPYTGGTITVLGQQRDVVLSSEKTVALWQRRNGCRANPQTLNIDLRPNDGVSVRLRNWTCSGAPLRHYTVQGGGHTWPSGRQFLPVRLVGPVSQDIDAADEAWAFFSQF
ncbi:MAG: PHB depolymerase family esterase [Pseudomonadota bacterium]